MAISHGFNKTEAATSVTAPVTVNSGLQIVVGTAPVNMLDDPEAAVNTPLLVNTFKEAAAAVGYSSDFAKYTLCEAVSASFQVMGISPIVVVNVLDAHAANNVNFQTDYDKRVEKIGAVVDGCSLLLEYLTICTEEGIISAKKAGIWTKKVTDVKYPAMKWLTSERGRAEKLRAEAERKRLTEQAAALKAVLYPEP